MTAVNDEKPMTCAEIKRHLKSVNSDDSEVKNSLLKVVEQFQCLDHIARSIGLVKKGFSFVNRVSWKSVFEKLDAPEKDVNLSDEIKMNEIIEAFSESSSQLEHEVIPLLQKWRNEWMMQVILIEFVFFSLLSLIVAGVTHTQGFWSFSSFSFLAKTFLYERPILIAVAGALLFITIIITHFRFRNFVALKLAGKLAGESSDFDLVGAFLKNTRARHSIFRPDIIGWNWLNRKCLSNNNAG